MQATKAFVEDTMVSVEQKEEDVHLLKIETNPIIKDIGRSYSKKDLILIVNTLTHYLNTLG